MHNVHSVHSVHSVHMAHGYDDPGGLGGPSGLASRRRGQTRGGPGRAAGRGPRGGYRGGGPGGRRSRSGRVRVSRGDIRHAILLLLNEQPMHGYQVMQELEDRSGGAWKPSPGSIYPTLQQLSDEGLIASDEGDNRNVYSLTATGREVVESLDGLPAWERFGGDDIASLMDVRQGLHQLGQAVKQVMATGDRRQIEAASTVLTEARRSIYRLLADDDTDDTDDNRPT